VAGVGPHLRPSFPNLHSWMNVILVQATPTQDENRSNPQIREGREEIAKRPDAEHDGFKCTV